MSNRKRLPRKLAMADQLAAADREAASLLAAARGQFPVRVPLGPAEREGLRQHARALLDGAVAGRVPHCRHIKAGKPMPVFTLASAAPRRLDCLRCISVFDPAQVERCSMCETETGELFCVQLDRSGLVLYWSAWCTDCAGRLIEADKARS